MNKSVVLAIAVAGGALLTSSVRAGDLPTDRAWNAANATKGYDGDRYQLGLDSTTSIPADAERKLDTSGQKELPKSVTTPVLTLDAAPVTSKIHGFLDIRVATSYLTPRGLQVVNQGLVVQPLAGLVFDLYSGTGPINDVSFIAGIWSNLTSSHSGGDIWNECDFFAGFDVKFLDKWDFSTTAMIWTFPDVSTKNESDPSTEYNIEFKLGFDDTEYLKDFAMHPYVSLFWNFEGDSPVVLGTTTFYIELGVTPSYTIKAIDQFPITLTFPTYMQFGDSSFWGTSSAGDRSNMGLISTGMKVSVPLSFIPKEYGSWNAYVGFTYIHTCNNALTEASEITGSGYSHEKYLGYAGIGMGF